MLLSMTGYGEARFQSDQLTVAVELRAVNNRYLKITLRAAEPYNQLEPEIEKVLRRALRRGTIQVHLRVHRAPAAQDYRLNVVALRSYLEQLRAVQKQLGLGDILGDVSPGQVLALPGVVAEPGAEELDGDGDWSVVEPVLQQAIARLQAMRQEEGRAMGRELLQLRDEIGRHLAIIQERSPLVVSAFRDRVHERVRSILAELDIQIDRSELIKEVAVFAERSDIAEEVVRLSSHLDQFQVILEEPESPGRKLEFLTQEMFREANTIGSKGNDVQIAQHVVEIKGAVEKIRELIQNIE